MAGLCMAGSAGCEAGLAGGVRWRLAEVEWRVESAVREKKKL